MLQRLPIALAQVKAGNNLENSLNEIRQIVYSPYQSKEVPKKVYNNIIKSVQRYIYYKNALFNWTQGSNICKRLWIFDFCKNIGKHLSNKYSEVFLIVPKTLQQKLTQREQLKKQEKQQVI